MQPARRFAPLRAVDGAEVGRAAAERALLQGEPEPQPEAAQGLAKVRHHEALGEEMGHVVGQAPECREEHRAID